MCVQKLIFSAFFVLPETIAYRNSSNYKNCHIKFSLNIFSNQITHLPNLKFYIFVVKQIYT